MNVCIYSYNELTQKKERDEREKQWGIEQKESEHIIASDSV